MSRRFLWVGLFLFIAAAVYSQTPSATELLNRVDNNEIFTTISYDGEMIIEQGRRRIVKTMKSWAQGSGNSLIIFTNREDVGHRYLKMNGEFWMVSPDIERERRIEGHLLRNWMGSDFSYEETIDNETLSSRYTAVLSGSEIINGRDAWILDLTARNRTESYQKRKLWIDKEHNDLLRYELFALSGAKLMEYTLLRVEVINGRRFPVETEMRDLQRRDSKTTFVMRNVVLDRPVADWIFTRRALTVPVASFP